MTATTTPRTNITAGVDLVEDYTGVVTAVSSDQGQIPHRDFASAWGPLFFLIQAAGLTISGMRPAGLGYATALFGAAVALWTYLAARTRMAAALACALGIYAVLLITAPFPLGFNPLAFSYAMAYNRYGYALLGIILVECGLQAFRRRPESGPWPAGHFPSAQPGRYWRF